VDSARPPQQLRPKPSSRVVNASSLIASFFSFDQLIRKRCEPFFLRFQAAVIF
jgi:hypothetical protein